MVVEVVKPTLVADFGAATAEDAQLLDQAKGLKPIQLPRVKAKLQGDPSRL